MRGEPVRPCPKPGPHCLVKRKAKREQETAWQKVRKQVLARDGFKCRVHGYGGHTGRVEVHHMKRRSQGRNDSSQNLFAVCAGHHAMLTANAVRAVAMTTRGADGALAFEGAKV